MAERSKLRKTVILLYGSALAQGGRISLCRRATYEVWLRPHLALILLLVRCATYTVAFSLGFPQVLGEAEIPQVLGEAEITALTVENGSLWLSNPSSLSYELLNPLLFELY